MSNQNQTAPESQAGSSNDTSKHKAAEVIAVQEDEEQEQSGKKVRGFFFHPVFITLAAVASLISVPLSVYFYFAAKERPELTYYTHPVKATVVRSGQASRITAIFDNKPVQTDITAAQVAIWNQGRKSIRKDQVLKPVVIRTGDGSPILEATIRKESRDVTQLSLGTEEIQKGRLTVLWNILEQNDGGVIQLIYAGNTDVPIIVDGVIEGQTQINRLEFGGKIMTPYEQYEADKTDYKGIGILTLVLAGFFFLFAFRVVGDLRRWTRQSIVSLKSNDKDMLIDSYNQSINSYKEQFDFYKDLIKQVEDDSDQYIREGRPDLTKSNDTLIKSYRDIQQSCVDSIKEYEGMKTARVAERREKLRTYLRREKRANIVFGILVSLGVVALIVTIYFFFVARPAGPPFGF